MSTETYAAADPATVEAELIQGVAELDVLGKTLGAAVEEYNKADEAWLELYDAVAEGMEEERKDAGRPAPAEHLILSTARRQHRAAYTRWKRAKRAVDRIDKQMQAARTVVSARQTQANGLRDEMKMGVYAR